MIEQIEKAVRTGKKMTLIYLSDSGRLSKRTIQIISCTAHRVVAYCYLRQQLRTFRIANMLALEVNHDHERMEAVV